ncbi:hypothetical protein SAMN02745866_01657 [Alteromonadaceae bacterium Bs31]|nr:hypothetical protein SAMN02745866_01657 [Alteromonadaceae bacterium Bs31]
MNDQPSSCCKPKPVKPSCCNSEADTAQANEVTTSTSCCDSKKGRPDYLLWGSLAIVTLCYAVYLSLSWIDPSLIDSRIGHFSHAVYDILNTMAWGAALGIFMVALLCKVPRDLVMSLLGTNGGLQGMLRATGAGLLLDLCSHGILMVGAKLYERGASTGQVMAFLIASPWNSFSLTLILVAMIGLSWTLAFIVLSALVAIVTGLLFDMLVQRGTLPSNPNTSELPEDFAFWPALAATLKQIDVNHRSLWQFAIDGLRESRMVLRWLLFGVVLAALVRTFVPADYFGTYFGPTALGLGITLLVATVLEVCSEGSTPIAADIFTRAAAPGNSFAFLMTGVSTDYTEIMVLKDTTRSWKLALFLPLLTLPQIIIIAFVLNGL